MVTLPACPTCGGTLAKERILDDVRESRLADGSQRLEPTGEVDSDGHAILADAGPNAGEATIRVWVFTLSCAGCLSIVRTEIPASGTQTPSAPFVVMRAPEVARLRERLVRARDDGRLEAEVNALRLADQFRLLGVPELWREARAAIPEEVRLVVNAGWSRMPPLSPIGTMPTSLAREKFRATAHPSIQFASGGGIVFKFQSFLAGTRLRVLGVRRGLLRVVPVESIPDDYEVPPLCASWSLVGKLD